MRVLQWYGREEFGSEKVLSLKRLVFTLDLQMCAQMRKHDFFIHKNAYIYIAFFFHYFAHYFGVFHWKGLKPLK